MKSRRVWIVPSMVLALGFALLLVLTPTLSSAEEATEQKQTRWENQAEETFGIGMGLGRKLMTQEEWREHQRKMKTMTVEEHKQYRKEIHTQMVERAKERGITMPETSGPGSTADRPMRGGSGKGGRGGGGGRGR